MLALGMVLPFLTGQIPSVGSRLLPMHIPALLTGYISGPMYGLLVGFVMPLFRSMIFGMPPMFPTAVAMAFELATYGFIAGLLYRRMNKNTGNIYLSLIIAMIIGRFVWGLVSYVLYGLGESAFTWQIFTAGAFVNALPGILIQLILIPVLVLALKKGKIL
jgi:uncharacterized membrane protein